MKIKKILFPLIATLSIAITACNNPKGDSEKVLPEPEDSSVAFTLRKMNAYYYSATNTIEVNTYFRNDRLTNLPYVTLSEYYKLLTKHDLSIAKEEDGSFKVTTSTGEAYINTELDTLESDDYQEFISTTIYRQENAPNVYYDGAPFLKIKEVTYDQKSVHTSINFKKYGINLFEKDGDILLPLATASNMFMGPTMITCFYTKDNIYFIDPNDPKFETGGVINKGSYYQSVMKFFDANGKRTQYEANFSYGELCFLIDVYYGLPGREYIHNELDNTRDLDSVLSSHSVMTKKAKEFLISTDIAEYCAGMEMLGAFLYDAGHTVSDYGVRYLTYSDRALMSKVNSVLSEIGFRSADYQAKSNYNGNYLNGLSNARNLCNTKDNSYTVIGDTAFYRFDTFDFDIYDWNEYYSTLSSSKLPKDPIGNFKRMLDKYKDDPLVKNVVVDITTNGGGYGDVVAAFMGLMGKRTYQYTYDTIGDRHVLVDYEFDKNFDGVFDEKDEELVYDYNFAIHCSSYSFSCGNLLPTQAKENGIMILGDKSGGGSCAIIDAVSAEGLYIRLSCPDHMVTLDNEEVEFGVEADYKMVVDNGDGTYDFSHFYDISIMSREMNNFYSNN